MTNQRPHFLFYRIFLSKKKKIISTQREWKENDTTYFVSGGQAMIIIYLFIRLLVETIYFSYTDSRLWFNGI